jgi:tRNA 2-thiouridine synthesizing protein E
MQRTGKIVENPDSPSPRRSDRELDMQGWSEDQGRLIAAREGIELTDAHWEVVYCLRDYFLDHGPPKNGRQVGDMLDQHFDDRGGRKYLRRLFPEGPVAQGMRIGGLPVPPYTEDEGFGTSR